MKYRVSGRRWTACAVAGVIALAMLALVLVSARAMAAPPPPTPVSRVAASSSSPSPVCFYREQQLECVRRLGTQATGSPQDQARRLLLALVEGPTSAERASGLRSALPAGAQLADVTIRGDAVAVKLALPEPFLYGGLGALVSEEINEQIIKTLYPVAALLKFDVLAQDPRDPGGAFKPLSYFLFEPPPSHKESAAPGPSRVTMPEATGALAGKAVYLSAGHGWFWHSSEGRWKTQRFASGSFDLTEDFNNAEVVNQYLIQYLRNAGADVWPVRESDMNTQEMIVIHDQPGYSAEGAWGDSTTPGYSGVYHYTNTVASGATATATWTFTPTVSGRYAVYAWYAVAGPITPTSDAQYLVAHAGGTTEVHVNQRMHGGTWRYIGAFPFAANAPGRVILTNQSGEAGTYAVADSVRVGGGMGTVLGDGPPPSSTPSGKPRWEEAARYWAKYQGAPPAVYAPPGCVDYYGPGTTEQCQDVTARPRYAEWERETVQDSVYLSWHSNGYDGSVRGTESYVYNDGFTPGSDQLDYWVHSTLIADIRAGWDPAWTDRGMKQANLGEVRLLSTMPGALFEIAFHDQQDDANALKDPRFAQLTARAMYKGIVRYFSETQSIPLAILPEPPRNLVVRNSGPGQATVSWRPPLTDSAGFLGDAATGYRVYTSADGLGWNDGVATAGTVFTLTGLAPGQLVFVRVTATNTGGESFPTPIAAARIAEIGPAPVLIVNGYERIDRWMDISRCDAPAANCPNVRIWPAQMNDQSYVVQHGLAITLPFDSAVRGAVEGADVELDAYDIVDWIAGLNQVPAPVPQGTDEMALTQAERDALAAYLNGGHALFLSGAEVAFDLATNAHDPSFLTGTLRAQYVADDANTFSVSPSASGILSGLGQINFDDGSHGSYAVNYADVLAPANGSAVALNYVGGAGGAAGIEYANGCQRLVYLGIPFETIYPAAVRQAVMARVISFLDACQRRPPITTILSPANGGFYKSRPAIYGSAADYAGVNHVDVAVVQITTPLRFLAGATWVASETWVSATGSVTWAFTPSVSLPDGHYAVWARAWNQAGLSSTQTAAVSFTMDTIAPTAPVPLTPTGGVTVTDISPSLVYSPALDANGVAGYNVLVDSQPYTTSATSLTVAIPSIGMHTWAVRAFDMADNASNWVTATFVTSHTLTYLPILMRDHTPQPDLQCQEQIVNGGFETQDTWYSLSFTPTYVYSPPDPVHGGLASLLIGYTTTANAPGTTVFSSIQTTITIPPAATEATLTFWRYPVSSDTRDYQYVSIGPSPASATTTLWTRSSNEGAWTHTAVDLAAFSGTLSLRLGVVNKGGDGVTAMYLDDVSVQTCSP
jgi:N-acetylmuramoyl-L-alanine amidase/Fibronectin type III domain/Sporulation and spore germination